MLFGIIAFLHIWILVPAQKIAPLSAQSAVLRQRCLLGHMTDVQRWVDKFGNLTSEVDQTQTLDVSRMSPQGIEIEQRIRDTRRRPPIKYLSMANCGLTRVPMVFQIQSAAGWALANTVEYLTLYGNEFYDYSEDGQHYDVELNATSYKEVDNSWFQKSSAISPWAAGFNHVTFTLLKELDLRNCHIQKLGGSIFEGMVSLEALYLGENNIFHVSQLAFKGLHNLIHLDLSDNFIVDETMSFESNNTLRSLTNLKSLDLSYTRLSKRSCHIFAGLSESFERLSVCHTNLNRFSDSIFDGTSLKYLDISGNTGILGPNSLAGIEDTLQILYANSIGLTTVDIFRKFKALDVLMLSNNEVTFIPHTTANDFKNLRVLDLSNNRVTTWFVKVFGYMTNLEFLVLRSNNINLISEDMLEDFSNITYLAISENLLVCNCHSREFFELAFRNEFNENVTLMNPREETNEEDSFNFNTAFRDINEMILRRQNMSRDCNKRMDCNRDANLDADGRFLLLDFREDMYQCIMVAEGRAVSIKDGKTCAQGRSVYDVKLVEANKKLLALISIPIALIAILVFCYTFRWNIRYCYITMRNSTMLSLINKEDSIDESSTYVYDVFVSYCNNDRNWVLDYLLPHLEEQYNVSVCLHERDFQVGLSILENIVSCMDRSRTIMLIISKKFLQSQWCQFEMHLAQHRLLETRREDLILVLLEDIPRRSRPTTLHYLMVTKTYIVWPRQDSEQAMFWRRLHNSLLQYRLKQHQANVTWA